MYAGTAILLLVLSTSRRARGDATCANTQWLTVSGHEMSTYTTSSSYLIGIGGGIAQCQANCIAASYTCLSCWYDPNAGLLGLTPTCYMSTKSRFTNPGQYVTAAAAVTYSTNCVNCATVPSIPFTTDTCSSSSTTWFATYTCTVSGATFASTGTSTMQLACPCTGSWQPVEQCVNPTTTAVTTTTQPTTTTVAVTTALTTPVTTAPATPLLTTQTTNLPTATLR